jgi:internalin A
MPSKQRYPYTERSPDESFAEADDRIATAIAERSETLDLSNLGLVALPESIGQLHQITTISLSGNRLTQLPESLRSFNSLETLYLYKNELRALPEWLGQLTQLVDLSGWGNRVTKLPESLGHLKYLQKLDLAANQLISLPESIGNLKHLRELDLGDNQLATLPDSIGELGKLEILVLYANQLKTLPISLARLRSLRALFLEGNFDLQLPAAVLGPPWQEWFGSQKNVNIPAPRSILDYYFRTRTTHERRPLREAKLILIGRGEVGKTSLVKRLVENKFSRREDRTQGIRITQWPLAVKRTEEVRMHIWDFGGQEIMHATHQFFLTDRSVYMLVLDGRGGQQEREADYWLRIVGSFAPESPVIVVLNKIIKDPFDLNRRAFQDKYPQIKAFVETDCDNPNSKEQPGSKGLGIEELHKAITRETSRLPDLRAAFPAAWFEIKEKLSKSRKNFLSFDEYRVICAKSGEQDEGAQESLATHLHRLGIALNFREDRRLRDTHVLNPHWVTEGIYGLLNSPRLASAKGELRVGDLKKELDQTRYPEKMHQFLLDLMEKFELCFSFPTGGRYLIPELLDPQQPKEADRFDPSGCLNFQYHYPVLPAGLLPRFIVRTHVLSEKHRWRTGVILNFEGNTALVKADLQELRVYISIDGPVDTRRRMLAVIREDFEAIHSDIQHLKPAEMVPLPNHPQVVVPYRDLEVLESNDLDAKWQQVIDRDVVVLPVRDLLNGVDLGPRSPRIGDDDLARMGRGRSDEEPLLVFYSYAHVDSRHRLSLKKHLSPLRRLRLITDWYDHDIDPGDEWAEEISRKLNAADIVLLLISADFVDSNYCYDTELAEAMKKHEAGKARVIPVIVRPTNGWTNLPFGKLNALPEMGKAIPKWPTHDEGWTSVAAGVESVARQLLARRTSAAVH